MLALVKSIVLFFIRVLFRYKYYISIPVIIAGSMLMYYHWRYWAMYQLGKVKLDEYAWVMHGLKPYSPVCPTNSMFKDSKGLCPANHPYYTPEYQQQFDIVSNSVLTSGNEVKLLKDRESFEEKIKLINGAKQTIYIASLQLVCSKSVDIPFTFSSPEKSVQDLVSALISARNRGVDVRLFLDGQAIWRLREGNCVNDLLKNGVKVVHTPYSLLPSDSNSHRTHEKLFIVDANTAIVGGQNMAAWWFDSNGIDRNFRDTDLIAKGPVASQVAQRFAKIWIGLKGPDKELHTYLALLREIEEKDRKNNSIGTNNYPAWLDRKKPGLCRFVAQDPHLGSYHVLDSYMELAKVARHHIRMQVPAINTYQDPKLIEFFDILTESVKNGTMVDLFTNTRGFNYGRMLELTDKKIDPISLFGLKEIYALEKTKSLYRQTQNADINIYAYRSWLHSKLFFFDDIVLSVGSFNYDESATSWTESTFICMDPKLTEEALKVFESDRLNSNLLLNAHTITKNQLSDEL